MNEFRRMMQRVLKNKWQEQWITACLVLLPIGLLFSRALVSFSSVLMVVPYLSVYKNIRLLKIRLYAMALILLPVLVSGIWSSDTGTWTNIVAVKLPMLTMLLGLCAFPLTSQKWILAAGTYIIIICAGCCWSLLQYANHTAAMEAAYLQAKVLPVLADNDHVRFSWMVMTAFLLAVKCLTLPSNKTARILLVCLLLFFVAYLHILASKTGLLCLYTCGIIYFLYLIMIRKKWTHALGVMAMVFAVALIAYFTLPTLRNRIQYIRYDFSLYQKGGFTPGYNDGARLLSIRAGAEIIQQHPLFGVGFGDIRSAVNEWHQRNHPESFAYERFLPANEWLVYGAGSGWAGMICFTAGLLLLLIATTKKNILSVLLAVTAFIPLLTDDTLEGQFGAVLLCFIVFFGQQELPQPVNAS